MIYVSDCSVRVVRSYVKKLVQEIFVQVFHNEKKQIMIVSTTTIKPTRNYTKILASFNQ